MSTDKDAARGAEIVYGLTRGTGEVHGLDSMDRSFDNNLLFIIN